MVTNLREAKKLSSGVLLSNEIHSLKDPRFLEVYKEKRKKLIEKEEQIVAGKKERLQKRISAVTALRAKHRHEHTHLFPNFSMGECGIYLQYKKQSQKDPSMPKDLEERRG